MSAPVSRRSLLRSCLCTGALAMTAAPRQACAGLLDRLFKGDPQKQISQSDAPQTLWRWSKEAYDYISVGANVECRLCPNQCKLEPESRGRCKVRVHKYGKLYSLVYGNPAAVHIDPIEKKPLYHFHPQSEALSLGFAGCNFRCLNCQNWELSQKKPEELQNNSLFPDEAVALALQRGCRSIAYTYNEPSVVYEYMLDTAREARTERVCNVWVTNGYMNREPLERLCEVLDAANVDLKSFSDDIYKKLNQGTLQPVLDTLQLLKKLDVWFEITTLIVPTYSDDLEMIRRMCGWILEHLGPDYPVHFSRFRPEYRLDHLPPTPPSVLLEAREIAMSQGLHYVYVGNYRTPAGNESNTVCPGCRKEVVVRDGFALTRLDIKGGACAHCGAKIAGRW